MATLLTNISSESKVPHPDEFNPYFAYVGAGVFFFTVVNYLTRFTMPATSAVSFQAAWKWRNIATSLVHSTITAIWSPLGFYLHPEMCSSMAYAFNHSTHVLISFSVGYFIYDFLDMFLYNQKNSQKNTYELLLHHCCAIACFGVSSHTRTLLPFASLALVVEINSVFLHIRQLFILLGKPRHATAYRNVALLNIATFVLFRIVLFGWMARWLSVNKDSLPMLLLWMGSVGVTLILGMNAVLLYRILNRDFFCTEGLASANEQEKPNGACKVAAGAEDDHILIGGDSTTFNGRGIHPMSKDVNRIMRNLFDDGAIAVFDSDGDSKEPKSKKDD